MSRRREPAVFALQQWTIKRLNGERAKFYIVPTSAMAFRARPWVGPYRSLQAASAAVARRLAEEWLRRNDKRAASQRGECGR
jgi:hypothetical protein